MQGFCCGCRKFEGTTYVALTNESLSAISIKVGCRCVVTILLISSPRSDEGPVLPGWRACHQSDSRALYKGRHAGPAACQRALLELVAARSNRNVLTPPVCSSMRRCTKDSARAHPATNPTNLSSETSSLWPVRSCVSAFLRLFRTGFVSTPAVFMRCAFRRVYKQARQSTLCPREPRKFRRKVGLNSPGGAHRAAAFLIVLD